MVAAADSAPATGHVESAAAVCGAAPATIDTMAMDANRSRTASTPFQPYLLPY